MVNKIRQSILDELQNTASWESGESLSRKYGISRVAVWKHIKALREEGYLIDSGHKGYKMLEGDNLTSMDFNPSEKILFYKELTSTMKEARIRMINAEEEPEEFIILADYQSEGIGREESDWDSPRGGLYMTCILNKPRPLGDAPLLPLRGILSILQALETEGVKGADFLWPGDIMLGEKKIGGILDEYCVREGQIVWYALGMGVHINDALGEPANGLSSVAEITGQKISRKDFIRQFKEAWKDNLRLSPSLISERICRYARFLHNPVLVETRHQGTVEGTALSIDAEGRLNLRSDSSEFRISTGESIKFLIGEENG